MPDYKQGKIYAVRSHHTDDVYIGSTIQTLSKRMAHHRCRFKTNDSFTSCSSILKHKDAYIELVEDFPCDNIDQLRKREGETIRNTLKCVNMRIAGQSKQDYRDSHKTDIAEHAKVFREKHMNAEIQKAATYYQNHKDTVALKHKKYYEENKYRIWKVKPTSDP